MNDQNRVNDLYVKKNTLSTRINLHQKYSVNKYGWNNWVFDQYSISENNRIIEFGCGTGSIWKDNGNILPNCVEIILTDISPLMIEKAKENLSKNKLFSYHLMDIQNVPFPDNSFDIVIANHMLYHVPDIQKALSEIKRILKNNGVFYATTVGMYHLMQLETIYRIFDNLCKFSYSSDLSFILENGYNLLRNYFSDIDKRSYIDSLEVTDASDLMDYIASYNNIPKKIYQEIEKIINKEIELNGIMKISKNSGMFICKK